MLMRRHTIVSDVITCCAVVVENIITGLVQLFLTDARNGTGRDNHVLPLVTKDNNCIYILLNVTTRRDANGKVTGVVGVGQDFIKIREVMAHSKSVEDGITRLIVTASAPPCAEWDRMASKITYYDVWSVMDKPFVKCFIRAGHQDAACEIFVEALKDNGIANFVLLLYSSRGNRRDVVLNATAQLNTNGEVFGAFGVERTPPSSASGTARQSESMPTCNALATPRTLPPSRSTSTLPSRSGTCRRPNYRATRRMRSSGSIWWRPLRRGMPGTDSTDFESPLVTKCGVHREVLMNITAMRGADNKVTGDIDVLHVITDIRKMAAEQKDIADDLACLIRYANAPILSVSRAGEVTEWNDGATAIVGFTRVEAPGEVLGGLSCARRTRMRPAHHRRCMQRG